MNKEGIIMGEFNYLPKRMKELILCFTEQCLNEFPWAITFEEYVFLRKISRKRAVKTGRKS